MSVSQLWSISRYRGYAIFGLIKKFRNGFDAIRERDVLLYYPYHTFERVAPGTAASGVVLTQACYQQYLYRGARAENSRQTLPHLTKRGALTLVRYAHIGTGSFNEKQRGWPYRLFADRRCARTNEVRRVFGTLKTPIARSLFDYLMVSPQNSASAV